MSFLLNTTRLKECREKLGITKMEAAKRMQLSQPAYLRYEAGTRNPSLQTMAVIANCLNTSIEYLTNQSDDPLPIAYTISRAEDPGLFELIRSYKNGDKDMIDRISAYSEKLSSQNP